MCLDWKSFEIQNGDIPSSWRPRQDPPHRVACEADSKARRHDRVSSFSQPAAYSSVDHDKKFVPLGRMNTWLSRACVCVRQSTEVPLLRPLNTPLVAWSHGQNASQHDHLKDLKEIVRCATNHDSNSWKMSSTGVNCTDLSKVRAWQRQFIFRDVTSTGTASYQALPRCIVHSHPRAPSESPRSQERGTHTRYADPRRRDPVRSHEREEKLFKGRCMSRG